MAVSKRVSNETMDQLLDLLHKGMKHIKGDFLISNLRVKIKPGDKKDIERAAAEVLKAIDQEIKPN